MINILPNEMRRRARVDYRLRFLTVSLLALSAVFGIGAALLLPVFFRAWVARTDLMTQANIAEQSLAQSSLAGAVKVEKATASLIAKINAQEEYTRPSGVISALLSARREGISVRRIEYQVPKKDTVAVRISGVAAKREYLLSFKQSLQAVSGVTSVDLPPDSLALSTNASFVVTVTFVPSKVRESTR